MNFENILSSGGVRGGFGGGSAATEISFLKKCPVRGGVGEGSGGVRRE